MVNGTRIYDVNGSVFYNQKDGSLVLPIKSMINIQLNQQYILTF